MLQPLPQNAVALSSSRNLGMTLAFCIAASTNRRLSFPLPLGLRLVSRTTKIRGRMGCRRRIPSVRRDRLSAAASAPCGRGELRSSSRGCRAAGLRRLLARRRATSSPTAEATCGRGGLRPRWQASRDSLGPLCATPQIRASRLIELGSTRCGSSRVKPFTVCTNGVMHERQREKGRGDVPSPAGALPEPLAM
jgi:hypothetical protein